MKTEKVLAIIVILSTLMKMFHVPGGSVFLILSILTLTILYFPLGFYFLSDKSYKENTITSIIFGWLLSVCFVGIMFRIMHWPGAIVMNIVGSMTALSLAIFIYFKYKNSNHENMVYFRNLLIRSLILFILSFAFTFVTLPF